MSLLDGIHHGWAVLVIVRQYALSMEGMCLRSVVHIVDGGGYQPCCGPAVDLVKPLSLLWNRYRFHEIRAHQAHLGSEFACGGLVAIVPVIGGLGLAHIPQRGEGLMWV